MLIKTVEVKVREAEGSRFPYLDVGSEVHGRPSFRLWVSARLVRQAIEKDWRGQEVVKEYLDFPARAAITRTERGSLVLRPAEDRVTYNVMVRCGYRGRSCLQLLSPEVAELYEYRQFSSPLGSTGISAGALIVAPVGEPVKLRWERSGRLYGRPAEGIAILYPDGRVEEIDRLADGLAELEELRQLVEE